MSLYRTYRPKTFADVAGQEHVISTLVQATTQDKLAHAYVLSGTRGTGKTSTARILAKAMLTRGMEEGTLKQQILSAVDDGSLVDLVEIDAASNRGIDDIRNLLEKIQFTPVVATAKVYIIDEAHMLTREAANALLKTLEEPPPYAFFILATTELHKIPLTIQSRCQRYLFRQIKEEDIIARLRYVADTEQITIDDDALAAIAHHVQGGLRDALSLLDQLRSLPHVTLQDVRGRIGESGFEHVETVMHALTQGDRGALLATVQHLEESGVPLDHFVRLLLAHVRNTLHRAVAERQDTRPAERMLSTFLDAVRDLRTAPVPGLVLEAALLSLCAGETNIPAKPAPVPTTIATPPPPSTPSAAPSSSLQEIQSRWPEILERIEPAAVRMSLKNGTLQSLENGTLTMSFTSTFHREKASSPEASLSIERSIMQVLGSPLALNTVMEGQASKAPSGDVVDVANAVADVF